MKYIFLSLIILLTTFAYSQTSRDEPNITDPSPQAKAFSTYGDIPVNGYKGTISPSIPIYNYNVGLINIPITLMYGGNGVKVEDSPTWTGMSWVMNAGGVITRQALDLPDETARDRELYDSFQLDSILYSQNETILTLRNKYANLPEQVDTETDIFYFNFPDASGNFVLIQNEKTKAFEPVILRSDIELKVEILGDFSIQGNYEFKITTPLGISYYFGGFVGEGGVDLDENGEYEVGRATEESQYIILNEDGNRTYSEKAITAFYLTKVEDPIGNTVYLEYYTKDEYDVFMPARAYGVIVVAGNADHLRELGYTCAPTTMYDHKFVESNIQKNHISSGKTLKKIWTRDKNISGNRYRVNFKSQEISRKINNYSKYLTRILTKVELPNTDVLLKYSISHDRGLSSLGTKDKFFLNKLIFNNHEGHNLYKYELDYNSIAGIPNIFSKAQDFLGYYNGKSNATLLSNDVYFINPTIPIENLGISSITSKDFNNLGSNRLGDRLPVFNHAISGTLKKITYPTGGYTLFDYEPVLHNIPKYESESASLYNNYVVNDAPSVTNSVYQTSMLLGENIFYQEGEDSSHPILVTQDIIIKMHLEAADKLLSPKDLIYVKLIDLSTDESIEKQWIFPDPDNNTESGLAYYNFEFNFKILREHNYMIVTGFGDVYAGPIDESNNEFFTDIPIKVDIGVRYIDGMEPDNGTGIRIKRISNYTNQDDETPKIKRFYYSTLPEYFLRINKLSESEFPVNFLSMKFETRGCNSNRPIINASDYLKEIYLILNSHPVSSSNYSDGSFWQFPNVTTSLGGDNFENGAIETEYRIIEDSVFNYYDQCGDNPYCREVYWFTSKSNPKTRASEYNGLVKKETFWENKQTKLYKIKEFNTDFEFAVENLTPNIHGQMIGSDVYGGGINMYTTPNRYNVNNDFMFHYYNHKSRRITKKNSASITYPEGIPIHAYFPHSSTYPNGWPLEDDDNDGILNYQDLKFFEPVFTSINIEEIESQYPKVISNSKSIFHPKIAGMPMVNTTLLSDNDSINQKFYYPIDLPNFLNSNILIAKHIIPQLKVETKRNEKHVSHIGNEYYNNSLLKLVWNKKHESSEKRTITYDKYDSNGNILQYTQHYGIPVSIIWGYNGQHPIAKIEGVSYNQINETLRDAAIIASNNDTTNCEIGCNEAILRSKLMELREYLSEAYRISTSLSQSMFTAYTYDPLIGVTSITPPNGQTEFYKYDTFGRLISVKDEAYNKLKEIEYNYKNN